MKAKKRQSARAASDITIRPFRETDLDFVISRQLALYAAEYGFTSEIWKSYLIGGVNDFVRQYDSERDCMYIAEKDAVPCGCIAITHADETTAQLRFYFIEQEMRGKGAGHRLIDRAIGFCREMKYKQVFLWTFSTLDAARHLYAGSGFRMTETQVNNEWGGPILEERWELTL
jgi:GNAT superfamily N-acetyltransferase